MGLSPAQESELKFLRQRVDRQQDEVYKNDARFFPNAQNNLWAAREELDRYVRELRQLGHEI